MPNTKVKKKIHELNTKSLGHFNYVKSAQTHQYSYKK